MAETTCAYQACGMRPDHLWQITGGEGWRCLYCSRITDDAAVVQAGQQVVDATSPPRKPPACRYCGTTYTACVDGEPCCKACLHADGHTSANCDAPSRRTGSCAMTANSCSDARREHAHRFLHQHGDRWLCSCGKDMEEADVAEGRQTTPDYPASYDRIYPRCPVCRREQYGPAVIGFSQGDYGCHSCGHVIREDARLVRDA